jgi:hypothetical protein
VIDSRADGQFPENEVLETAVVFVFEGREIGCPLRRIGNFGVPFVSGYGHVLQCALMGPTEGPIRGQ